MYYHRKFLLITDPIIKNMATYKYTLYKTAKSQIVDHFYQHHPAKTAQCLSISASVKSAIISDFI